MGLRVCFVSSYPPNRARLSEYAQALVTALVAGQAIDSLYLLVDHTSFPESELSTNPKVKVFRVWRADSILSVLGVMRYIFKLRPDVVHFNVLFRSFGKSKLTNLAGLSLIILCRHLGFRVLAGVHTLGDMTDLSKFNVKPTLVNRIGILVATKFILSAQNVIVLVKSYSDYLKQRYGHKSVIYIPHGTSVDVDPRANSRKLFCCLSYGAP